MDPAQFPSCENKQRLPPTVTRATAATVIERLVADSRSELRTVDI
ncbi:hypothetical protein [Methylobacterium frigidaeris]|nr:hypothetical protein [Methylobacterium frigidaeris]